MEVLPTSATIRSEKYPMWMPVARLALTGGMSTTVGVWMRRDDTGLTMRLMCKANQLPGITSDVVASITAAADTWELVEITLTPTITGVVEIIAQAWGGATYNGWVSEMEIS